MELQNIGRDEIQGLLTHLDQALYNHQQWHNELIRIIACRLSPDAHDLLTGAYKECRFGQWYYGKFTNNIKKCPGFIAIGEAHKQMHQIVTHMLIQLRDVGNVDSHDYDNFANSLERLRLEIAAFKNELENILYKHDPLTMAINRINMLPILREQQESCKRQSRNCCLAMVDIDYFKKINDDYGHIVGDKILSGLARNILSNLRSHDKIFRYGGEEFLLCIQNISTKKALEMMERIREGINTKPFNVDLEKPVHISISCGIALLDFDSPVEESIDHADKALYSAKYSGRNRVVLWGPQINDSKTP